MQWRSLRQLFRKNRVQWKRHRPPRDEAAQKVENGELTEEELAGYEQALAQAQAELEAVNGALAQAQESLNAVSRRRTENRT